MSANGVPGARSGPPSFPEVDFAETPLLVIWETTQACDLACMHCRAEARPCRDSKELSTLEAMGMMNAVRRFGPLLFVLTGGDPFKRPDLMDLVRHGARLGLRMGLTPSATPLVTPEALRRLRDVGLARLAISIDGPGPEVHDRFRGMPGSFQRSLEILDEARALGLSTQVNTTVSRSTVEEFDAMAALVGTLGIDLWSVFFVVPTGRARTEDVAEAEEFEDVFHRMYDLARTAPFAVKSTAAPHYRRVVLQRRVGERRSAPDSEAREPLPHGPGFLPARGASDPGPSRRAQGVNDGNGFLFISHLGEIYPSGFLPLRVGSVRTDDLVRVYRESVFLVALRDPDRLKGKCGVCEFRTVCGGSRARAYAVTGDPLEAEPFCVHVPKRWARMQEGKHGEDGASDDRAARWLPVVGP